jgi:hypothetical protein
MALKQSDKGDLNQEDLSGRLPDIKSKTAVASVAAAVALAAGVGILSHRMRSIPDVIPKDDMSSVAVREHIMPAADLEFLDSLSEKIGSRMSFVFPESRYGYGEYIRSDASTIRRGDSGRNLRQIVLDTRRDFSGKNTDESSVLGDVSSECSERSWAMVFWLQNQIKDSLIGVETRPTYIPRTYLGESGFQEHWINSASVVVSGRRYSIYFDSTPMNSNAGPMPAAWRFSDPEEGVYFSRDSSVEDARLHSANTDESIGLEDLRRMLRDSKRVIPLSRGFQPMAVSDLGNGDKVLFEAAILEDLENINYCFAATRFTPGDAENMPLFHDQYWSRVSIPLSDLDRAKKTLSGSAPVQVLNTLRESGFRVQTSTPPSRESGLGNVIPSQIDILHHLILKSDF